MEAQTAQIGAVGERGQVCPAAKPHFATRFLPTLTDVAFIMPMLFIFLRMGGAPSLLGDGDTGWHIRTGEWILDHRAVPRQDIFSYTKSGDPWYAWEWLWDLACAWLHRHWGMAAVVIASTFVLSLTFALLFRLTRRQCSNPLLALGLVFLACASSSIHWLARPHLVTLLFTVIFWMILEEVRAGRRRLLFWLPALTVLWTNLHGGFVVGIILLLAYAAGYLLESLVEPDRLHGRASFMQAKPYLATAVACGAASLINPFFYHLHVHIAGYVLDPFIARNTDEFQSLSFQHPGAIYFEPLILAGVVCAAWCLYRRRFTQALLLIFWAHLGLRSARNMPIFVIFAAPVLAAAVEELCKLVARSAIPDRLRKAANWIREGASEFAATERLGRYPLASGFAAAGRILLFSSPSPSRVFRAEYDQKQFPAAAVNALRDVGPSGRVFTTDVWAGYLIYRLYPATKAFVDGRGDFYGAEFLRHYQDVMNGKFDWENTLTRYGVNIILLPVNASLASTLKESQRWRPIYDDKVAIIFRSQPAGRGLDAVIPSSAVTDSGVSGDRVITNRNFRDPRVTSYYARR